jgi:hypothetical protein
MKNILYIFLIFSFSFTIISCAKKSGGSSGSSSSDTNGSGGGSSYSSSCNNSKAFIVGNAVTEKGCHPNCPKLKTVIWNLDKCMTVVGDSSYVVDATEYNGSIYIADDGGYYWIVGNSISKQPLNYSGYKLSEVTGIDVNSNGDVYVAGMVVKKGKGGKEYNAYWKNGELVKAFRENGTTSSEKHVAADSKGNIFIPGWRIDAHHNTDGVIWINGNIKILEPQRGDVEATDAVVGSETASGSNVWISGAHGDSNSSLAGYWRRKPNGNINEITKVTRVRTYNSPKSWAKFSRATSIFISGSTVYMAGTVNVINAGEVPVYWKEKTQHELPVEFDLNTCDYCKAEPNDISLLDGNVLVVGDYYDEKDKVDSSFSHGEDKAVYWLDKKLHILCESCGSSYAVAVVVMD